MINTELWSLEDTAIPERWGKKQIASKLNLSFMKTNDYEQHLQLEKDVWKKVWAQLSKEGYRWDWHLWSRRFPSGSKSSFDLVAVHLFPAGEPDKQPPDDWWETAAAKVFPGKSAEEIGKLFEPTDQVRTIPIEESWEILEIVPNAN